MMSEHRGPRSSAQRGRAELAGGEPGATLLPRARPIPRRPALPLPAPTTGTPRTRSFVRLTAPSRGPARPRPTPRPKPRTFAPAPSASCTRSAPRPGPQPWRAPCAQRARSAARSTGPSVPACPPVSRPAGAPGTPRTAASRSARAPAPPRHPAPPRSGSAEPPERDPPRRLSHTSGPLQSTGRTSDFRFFLFSSKFPPSLNPERRDHFHNWGERGGRGRGGGGKQFS